jgi:hypothetical protein
VHLAESIIDQILVNKQKTKPAKKNVFIFQNIKFKFKKRLAVLSLVVYPGGNTYWSYQTCTANSFFFHGSY